VTGSPVTSALRTGRRLAAVGVDPDAEEASTPVCVLCAEGRLFALHAREGHHVAGRINDPELTAVVCLNCHAEQTERHRQVGVRLRDDPVVPPILLDRLDATLTGAGVFLSELGSRLVEWATYLRRIVAVLDDRAPGWRDSVGSVPGPRGITVPAVVPPPPGPVPGFPAGEVGADGQGGSHDL